MKRHGIIDIIERSQTRLALRRESDLNDLDRPSQVQIVLIEDTEVKPSGFEMDGARISTIVIPASTKCGAARRPGSARRDIWPDRSTAGEGRKRR